MIRKIALAASFALFGTAAQADQSFNVAIDGHCNTFTITVIDGIAVAGLRGGCGSAVEGGAVGRVDRERGVIISESTKTDVYTWFFTLPVAGVGKVYVVQSDGSTSKPIGASTYHVVPNTRASGEASGPDILAKSGK